MRNSVEGMVGIAIPGAQAAQIGMLAESLDGLHWKARAEIDSMQLSQLASTLRWHSKRNAALATRIGNAIIPKEKHGMDWLRDLPPLTRSDWQAIGDGMFNDAVPHTHGSIHENSTSGSTGEPVRVRRTDLCGTLWAAHAMLDHEWHHRDVNGRLMAVRGDIHQRQDGDDWGFPVAMLRISGKGLGLPITTDVAALMREIDSFKPNTLLIYPSMLRACLEHWANGHQRPTTIDHVKTIGETVTDALRTLVDLVLHLPVEDTYSSNEVGTIALNCSHGSYHVMQDSLIVEVLDDGGRQCHPGETGRVVITDLVNWATPVIRYDIGDWATVGDRCSCGRRSATLQRVMGRTRNLVVHPDGRRNWPLTGFKGFGDIAPIRQYQVVQHAVDDVELRVVCRDELSVEQSAELVALVQRFLGHPFPLRITRQAAPFDLPRNGKHEEFVCEVI